MLEKEPTISNTTEATNDDYVRCGAVYRYEYAGVSEVGETCVLQAAHIGWHRDKLGAGWL